MIVAGVARKAHYLAMDLPQSDDCFVAAFPAETTEAFLEGHVRAFAYFGGVPRRILYDNTKLAVAKILGGGERKKTRAFSELQSHYLFAEKFGRPGKGNDKGKVEGLVGYARRNFLVPVPRVSSWEELNAHLPGAVPPGAGAAVARARRDDCGTFRARSCGTVAAAGDAVWSPLQPPLPINTSNPKPAPSTFQKWSNFAPPRWSGFSPLLTLVRVQIDFTTIYPTYPVQSPNDAQTLLQPLPDFQHDFKIDVIQDKKIPPKSTRMYFNYSDASYNIFGISGVVIEQEYEPGKIDFETMTVKVYTPNGQDVKTTFYLGQLR